MIFLQNITLAYGINMAEEKYDREEEIKQGYPNAIEVKSTVKEAGEAVAKLNEDTEKIYYNLERGVYEMNDLKFTTAGEYMSDVEKNLELEVKEMSNDEIVLTVVEENKVDKAIDRMYIENQQDLFDSETWNWSGLR